MVLIVYDPPPVINGPSLYWSSQFNMEFGLSSLLWKVAQYKFVELRKDPFHDIFAKASKSLLIKNISN